MCRRILFKTLNTNFVPVKNNIGFADKCMYLNDVYLYNKQIRSEISETD